MARMMRKAIGLIVVCVMLTGCGMTPKQVLRTGQAMKNVHSIYGNSDIKEEVQWKIRSAVGQ